jgi:NAD(P)-dependent dehydrogenase (short-subunit alcohol dehydrogenase family)
VIATTRARSLGALDALQAQGADVLELDVTAQLADLKTIADKATALHGRVDVVVNNAGYIEFGALEENTSVEVPLSAITGH